MILSPIPGRTALFDAVEDLRAQTSKDALWDRLNHWLAGYGITGNLYGTEAFPIPGNECTKILNSIAGPWLEDKLREGLFSCDEYVTMARIESGPILWGDASRIGTLSPEAQKSLEMDHDYQIVTGVTIPMRFKNGMGVSSIGCHVEGASWQEFDQAWMAWGGDIQVIIHAFDSRLRGACAGQLFPLTVPELDLLCRLAQGRSRKQVHYDMQLTETRFNVLVRSAVAKMNATNSVQAVATALVYGLITP
jgi:DNA-binding CsgD family transcriptional regulator